MISSTNKEAGTNEEPCATEDDWTPAVSQTLYQKYKQQNKVDKSDIVKI